VAPISTDDSIPVHTNPSQSTKKADGIHPFASFKLAIALYCALFLLCFWSVIIQGDLIVPHRQDIELGASGPAKPESLENRKFNDDVQGYTPDAFIMLHARRSHWLATWDPYNELGRPVFHQSVLSPSFPVTLPLSWIISDPFKWVTCVTLVASFLAGLFALLFAREWGLGPWPSLFAAVTITLSPTFIYWATFPMVAPTYGWALATYWSIARFARRRNFASWCFVAFSVYGLLTTGYPQMVLYNVYLGLGIALYVAYRYARRHSLSTCMKHLVLPLSLAGLCGLILALPAALDTYAAAMASARVHPDASFFKAVFPNVSSLNDIGTQIALWAFPQLYGNPISPAFTPLYNGLSMAPAAVFLACLPSLRRVWGWWLFIAALAVLIFSDHAFAFALNHLGMNLSRTNPAAMALIPIAMVAATQLDAFSHRSPEKSGQRDVGRRALWVVAALLFAGAWTIAVFHPVMPVKTAMMAAYGVVLVLCVLAAETSRPGLVVVVAILWLGLFDRQMLLHQPESDIARTSPIVKALASQTSDGSRYAMVGTEPLLPPNINAELGLASLHSYNSLSPLGYQDFVRKLGGESSTYGRTNASISESSLDTINFKLANIGAVVSQQPLSLAQLTLVGNDSGQYVYSVNNRWGRFMRLNMTDVKPGEQGVNVTSSDTIEPNAASVTLDQGDRLLIKLNHAAEVPTLLIVSQAFHDGWRATAGGRLRTVRVNSALQGVIIPPHVQELRLTFTSWARFAWIPSAGTMLMLIAGMVLYIRRRASTERRSTTSSPFH